MTLTKTLHVVACSSVILLFLIGHSPKELVPFKTTINLFILNPTGWRERVQIRMGKAMSVIHKVARVCDAGKVTMIGIRETPILSLFYNEKTCI